MKKIIIIVGLVVMVVATVALLVLSGSQDAVDNNNGSDGQDSAQSGAPMVAISGVVDVKSWNVRLTFTGERARDVILPNFNVQKDGDMEGLRITTKRVSEIEKEIIDREEPLGPTMLIRSKDKQEILDLEDTIVDAVEGPDGYFYAVGIGREYADLIAGNGLFDLSANQMNELQTIWRSVLQFNTEGSATKI